MSKRNILDRAMVEDLHKIIGKDMQLHEYWHQQLPAAARERVENAWLEWCWQMSLAAAEPMKGLSAEDASREYTHFGEFINNVKAANRVEFHQPEWVAMDRQTYTDLYDRAAKAAAGNRESET